MGEPVGGPLRATRKRAVEPLPKGLPAWPYQCEYVGTSLARCRHTAVRGAMRCKRHARVWELRSAGLRYLVWCLAPQLGVMDLEGLKYIGRELVWAHWRTYMEGLSDLSPEKRFELVAWMVDHYDDVSERGWIRSDGMYVYGEPTAEPWGEGRLLDEVRQAAGLRRGEIAKLLGCGVSGGDLRRLAQGFAWPDSALLMHRVVALRVRLEGLLEERGVEGPQMRAFLMTPVDGGTLGVLEAPYDGLMREAKQWNVPERRSMEDFLMTKGEAQ